MKVEIEKVINMDTSILMTFSISIPTSHMPGDLSLPKIIGKFQVSFISLNRFPRVTMCRNVPELASARKRAGC